MSRRLVNALAVGAQITDARLTYRNSHYEPEAFDIVEPGIGAIAIVKSEDRARRLVACWNACDGISTESVEECARVGGLKQIDQTVVEQGNLIRDLRAKRDELLAALEEAKKDAERYRWWCDPSNDIPARTFLGGKAAIDAYIDDYIADSAAIAKVKGGAV